jgi:hypothetical protein
MIFRAIRFLAKSTIPVLLLLLLLSAACGTLEVGIEAPAMPGSASTSGPLAQPVRDDPPSPGPTTPTPTPEDLILPTPAPAFTPMSAEAFPAPAGLAVVFAHDGAVWLWTAETRETRLLISGEAPIGMAKISDDGRIVAFLREGALWAVRNDGSGDRLLIDPEALDLAELTADDMRLGPFEWVPGRHVLAFSTVLRLEERDVPAHDLRLVDADTSEQTVLLPPGEGGEFYYSPSGDAIAIVTPSEISLVDADGSNRRDRVMTYTPIAMYDWADYYVRPAWAADGSRLMVAIPPVDPHAWPIQDTTIWLIPTDGAPARLVASIPAFPEAGAIAFSSGLVYVAFSEVPSLDARPTGRVPLWLKLMRLENGDWMSYPSNGTLLGWAPNSRRLAFLGDVGDGIPQLQIGQYSGLTRPGAADAGVPVVDFRWADSRHYIFLAMEGYGADAISTLRLASVDGASTVLASFATGPLVFDQIIAIPADAPGATGVGRSDVIWRLDAGAQETFDHAAEPTSAGPRSVGTRSTRVSSSVRGAASYDAIIRCSLYSVVPGSPCQATPETG